MAEIEGKFKKYSIEIILCVIYILTAIFALVWGGAMIVWSILLSMIFAIIGSLLPQSMHKVVNQAHKFIHREQITSIIIGIIFILVSIFLPAIIFAIIGLMAGKTLSLDTQAHLATMEKPKDEGPPPPPEE